MEGHCSILHLCLISLLIFLMFKRMHAVDMPKKRQIYREQVLPHAGGRIPETAFDPDRLFLNQLQKDGIAVPDGKVLQPRLPKVYPLPNRSYRKVLRIAATSNGRYVPVNEHHGHYNVNRPDSGRGIDTTYLHPEMNGHSKNPKSIFNPTNLHYHSTNLVRFQDYKTPDKSLVQQHLDVTRPLNFVKSYQNFNLLHSPISMKSFQLNSIYGHFPNTNTNTNTKSYLPITINSNEEHSQPIFHRFYNPLHHELNVFYEDQLNNQLNTITIAPDFLY